MRPWTIDADDIQVAEDFDASLLHRTNWIDDFLASGRDERFIVTGTKGFGKTLLLKAKRVVYQQSKSTVCLPENALLDKPIGDKVFSAEMIELYGHGTENWRKVWLISIAATVLKHLGMIDGLTLNPRLQALLGDPHLRSVIDHFVNLLDFPRGDLFRSGSETDSHLVPRLRSVNQPVALFVDSIDEYFNKHIVAAGLRASDAGELSAEVWHLSQMALVETAYQIRRVNHHVKVLAAVRKEAFSRLDDATPMVQQYRGSTVDIAYSAESLREIVLNNIRREKERNLVNPARLRADPIEAFAGMTHVTHGATGQREEVFEYIYRHTLQRPRDLMTIGQKLSDIAPAERSEQAIKAAVNQGATEIAREYLNEISPYIGLELEPVFALIRGNVLSREDLEVMFREHNGALRARGEPDVHVFCMLFKAGLLGHVTTDLVSSRRVQRFLRPGERTFDPDGILPQSPHYLIHPVLAELILRSNADYAAHADRVNVIGDGRPWQEEGGEEVLCVLQADIRDFSVLMERAEVEHAVRRRLREAVQTHASECRHFEVGGGDSITLVHHDASALIKVIRRIMEDLFEVEGHPVLRVAIDWGPVSLSRGSAGAGLISGAPFRIAARLEPHVTPNEIWVTGSFKQALERAPTLYEAAEIPAEKQSDGAWAEGKLNIRKQASREPDQWIRVFRIEDRSGR
jgi:class 3 adenylate cyclase